MSATPYADCPTEIHVSNFPDRGANYHAKYAEHVVDIFLTEKRKRIRVWVDGEEWVAK